MQLAVAKLRCQLATFAAGLLFGDGKLVSPPLALQVLLRLLWRSKKPTGLRHEAPFPLMEARAGRGPNLVHGQAC